MNPAKPQGDKNPLTNITKPPKNPPIRLPYRMPTRKVNKDVNSTLGGRGVSWIPNDTAVNTLSKAS